MCAIIAADTQQKAMAQLMFRRILIGGLVIFSLVGLALTQSGDALYRVREVELITAIDAFGIEVPRIIGQVRNDGDDALTNITIFADLQNDSGESVGEGFGFIEDECGIALLDRPLQPDQAQSFTLKVDLYDTETTLDMIENINVEVTSTSIEAEDRTPPDGMIGVTQVTDAEVVAAEWVDEVNVRYGVGCEKEVFTEYDWFSHNRTTDETTHLEQHPNEQFITESFLQRIRVNVITQNGALDETLFGRSMMSFPSVPLADPRFVFQNDIHNLFTVEEDGNFLRTSHTLLSRYSLRGYIWSPDGNFAAYYFGAHGDPVRYISASLNGSLLSALLPNNIPSVTVPGIQNDGRRVIISGETLNNEGEAVLGYFFQTLRSNQREFLFEVDALPGNNYPAPAYYRKDSETRYIYIIRPIDGQNMLQCYHREGRELFTLTPLPLQLETEERAWSWLSPDASTLAIAANGAHSGFWLVDLNAFEVCR